LKNHIVILIGKNEEQLSECLDRAILEVIDNLQKTQQAGAIGTQ